MQKILLTRKYSLQGYSLAPQLWGGDIGSTYIERKLGTKLFLLNKCRQNKMDVTEEQNGHLDKET